MVVPFPSDAEVLLEPPSADEVQLITRGFISATAPAEGPTRLQALVTKALVEALTGHQVDLAGLGPVTAEQHARDLARRSKDFRLRSVQMMVLLELLLKPIPAEVAARVESFADALGVGDDCRNLTRATRHLANGALGLAAHDFERNGYECRVLERQGGEAEHTAAEAWVTAPDDPEMAARWAALADCPDGSLGRKVWEFYRARGFVFPGLPDSAPPLLAKHDWVHVLADYGTTVESELEVFGLVYRANDDPRAFSLLVSVLGLFEAGYLQTGMGLFQMDVGHISRAEEAMALRLGDALRRGALAAWRYNDAQPEGEERRGIDLLEIDWFEHAAKPLEQVRAELHIPPKEPAAVAAGSVGPWESGGISPYQWRTGQEQAEAEGRSYESYGAAPDVPGDGEHADLG